MGRVSHHGNGGQILHLLGLAAFRPPLDRDGGALHQRRRRNAHPVKTTACFHGGIDPGVIPGSSQLATSVSVASYFVNLGYTGGSIGSNLNPGRRRQGDNMFDYAIGDVALNGWLETAFGGTPAKSSIMLADFDNGTALQDSGCRIGISVAARIGFRDTGRGTMKAISPAATRATRAS